MKKKKILIGVLGIALLIIALFVGKNVYVKHEAENIRDIVSKDPVFKEINDRKDITFDDNITLQNKEIDILISELESEKYSKKIMTKDLEEYADCMIDVMEKEKELNIALQNEYRCDKHDEKAYKLCVNERNTISSKYEASASKANAVYKSITGKDMIYNNDKILIKK